MKNLLFTLVFITSAICVSAQKVYFIYLQSDNYAPFYLKMNDKIYSSTTSGYLILSNLFDTTYTFSIGFPSSQSESRFTVKLNSKDKGFLIKNFSAGLGLFDLQNLTITNEQKDDAPKNISFIKRNDDFSSLLSRAAHDTTLLYAVVRVPEEDVAIQGPQPQPEETSQKTEEVRLLKDTNVAVTTAETLSEPKSQDSLALLRSGSETRKEGGVADKTADNTLQMAAIAAVVTGTESSQTLTDSSQKLNSDTLTNSGDSLAQTGTSEEAVFKRSQVKKHSESSTSEGFGLVFYDMYGDKQDTISLLIPNPPIVLSRSTENDSSELQKSVVPVAEIKTDTQWQAPVVVAVKTSSPEKLKCKTIASDNDFFKLRKNMAGQNTDEAMVAEAKKVFKGKCFATEQIKNLGALFLTSSGKYQFFDAAYLHVTDPQNFPLLESEIKDDYYLKRFKALIGE
jgi:hypothetical protein